MERLISCEFNMDTACVELKFVDGSMISIDTIAVCKGGADKILDQILNQSKALPILYRAHSAQ